MKPVDPKDRKLGKGGKAYLYVAGKIEHMERMGIPADRGESGGASPKWLIELKEADKKRRARRK